MSELNDYVRDDLIGALAPEQVAEIATQLDTDDAVAIIEDMEEDEQQAVLEALHPEDRDAIEDAVAYPEESAGRLMQRDLVAVPEYMPSRQEAPTSELQPLLRTSYAVLCLKKISLYQTI